jgi:hypothetical protein
MAKLNSCSRPIWIRPGIFHHVMQPAENGSIWTWHGEGTSHGHYHYLENFDPETGEHIRGLALVEDIIANSEAGSNIFGVRPDYPFRKFDREPEAESPTSFIPMTLRSFLINLLHVFQCSNLATETAVGWTKPAVEQNRGVGADHRCGGISSLKCLLDQVAPEERRIQLPAFQRAASSVPTAASNGRSMTSSS